MRYFVFRNVKNDLTREYIVQIEMFASTSEWFHNDVYHDLPSNEGVSYFCWASLLITEFVVISQQCPWQVMFPNVHFNVKPM